MSVQWSIRIILGSSMRSSEGWWYNSHNHALPMHSVFHWPQTRVTCMYEWPWSHRHYLFTHNITQRTLSFKHMLHVCIILPVSMCFTVQWLKFYSQQMSLVLSALNKFFLIMRCCLRHCCWPCTLACDEINLRCKLLLTQLPNNIIEHWRQ